MTKPSIVGTWPGAGALYGAVISAASLNRLCSFRMLNSWVLVCGYSSPVSGLGLSMSVATVYGTTLRSAPCSAHSGIGFDRSLPITPSKVLPSPGPYRRPSTLSSDRFSNTTTTT